MAEQHGEVLWKYKIESQSKDTVRLSNWGYLGGSVIEHLTLAQGVIPGSWDQVPHGAPRREPASPSASVSLMNK